MSAKNLINGGLNGIQRVLRRRGVPEYFRSGTWPRDPAEAETFNDLLEATQTCVRYGLNDVELALRYEANAADLFCTPIR